MFYIFSSLKTEVDFWLAAMARNCLEFGFLGQIESILQMAEGLSDRDNLGSFDVVFCGGICCFL
jgi:predicted O-methyltransferase YrrM